VAIDHLSNVSYAVPLSPASQLPAIKISSPHKRPSRQQYFELEHLRHHQVVQFQFY
jgi:hypothetical protein